MVVGGILAGGLGTRMSMKGLPKQFIEVQGIPVIIRTLQSFLGHKDIDYVVIAMNEDWMDYCHELMSKYNVEMDRVCIIKGGATRFESLLCLAKKSLEYAKERNEEDVVLINHDCARPFVSERIIGENIRMIEKSDMVTTSVPTIDTVLISKDGQFSDEVPERSTIFCDQGPQTFKVQKFLNLVENLTAEEKEKYMEAGRLYLDKGYKVAIVMGERENFKITTQFDLIVAEAMLKQNEIK